METRDQEPHELLGIMLVVPTVLRILYCHSTLEIAGVERSVCTSTARVDIGGGGDGEGRVTLP